MTTMLARSFAFDLGLDAACARLNAAMERRRRYNETMKELNALSERELTDLGFSRWDLSRIARESVDARV